MMKYVHAMVVLTVWLTALPLANVNAEVVVGDDDAQDGKVTYITLIWDRNPERDLGGYNVYYGRASGEYLRVETVSLPTTTIGLRGTKTLFFAVTAFDQDGVESEFSEEVHYP